MTRDKLAKMVNVIPKLAYYFTQDVYLGALITFKKKNKNPALLVDSYGRIVTYNRKAVANIFGTQAKFTDEHLSLMIPRISKLLSKDWAEYKELRPHDTFQFPFDEVPRLGTMEHSSEEDDKNPSNLEEQNSTRVRTLEAYFISPQTNPIPQESNSQSQNGQDQLSISELSQSIPKLSNRQPSLTQAQINWRKLRLLLSQSGGLKFGIIAISKQLVSNVKGLEKDPDRLKRVTIQVSRQNYQANLRFQEVSFLMIQKTSLKVPVFFGRFAENFPQHLAELLMISPTVLNSFYKINVYKKQLEMIESHLHSRNEVVIVRDHLADRTDV